MFSSLQSFAEEHPLSAVKGDHVDLKAYDHAVAGAIKDFVIWGAVDESTFSSELIMRRDGQTIKTVFAEGADGKVGGTIKSVVDGKSRESRLELVKIDKKAAKLVYSLNGSPMEVTITSDGFANGHFANPTYRTQINGQTYSFTLEGHACFGYSAHLSFLIFGALAH